MPTVRQSLVIFSLILSLKVVTPDTKFQKCGSTGEVLRLKVMDCENPPCYLTQMSNVTALIHFRTNPTGELIESLSSSFEAVLTPELVIPFPYKRTDVCSRLQNAPDIDSSESIAKGCPIAPGSEVVYYTILPLEEEYPMIQATVRWSLADQNNNTVACVEVPCEMM